MRGNDDIFKAGMRSMTGFKMFSAVGVLYHWSAYVRITVQSLGEVPVLIMYVQSAYLKDEPFAKQRERFKAFGQICAEQAGAIAPKAKGSRSANKPGKRRGKTKASANGGLCLIRSDSSYLDLARPFLVGGSSHRLREPRCVARQNTRRWVNSSID